MAELLTNRSFDTNVTGWTANANTAIDWVSTPAHEGGGALRITSTGAGGVLNATQSVAVTPGQVINASAWARHGGTARSMSLQIDWRTPANGYLSSDLASSTTATATYDIRSLYGLVVPTGAGFAQIKLGVNATVVGEVFYWDTASLTTADSVIDTWTGADAAAWDSAVWDVVTINGSSATQQGGRGRLQSGTAAYSDRATARTKSSYGRGIIHFDVLIPADTPDYRFAVSGWHQGTTQPTYLYKPVNGYAVDVLPSTGATILQKITAETSSDLATLAGTSATTYNASDVVHIDIENRSTGVVAWVWKNTGTRPTSPNLVSTDTSYTAGRIGMGIQSGGGGTPQGTVDFQAITYEVTDYSPISGNLLNQNQQDSNYEAGWSVNGTNTTLSRDLVTFKNAPASVKLTAIALGTVSMKTGFGSVDPVPAGASLVASTYRWAGAGGGRGASVLINWINASGGLISQSNVTATGSDTPNTFSKYASPVVTSPVGTTKAEIVWTITGLAAGESVYLDENYFGPPGADAGVDQTVAADSTVTLIGTPAGGVWSQDSGTAVTLSSPTTNATDTRVTFVATNPSTTTPLPRVFRYTVSGVTVLYTESFASGIGSWTARSNAGSLTHNTSVDGGALQWTAPATGGTQVKSPAFNVTAGTTVTIKTRISNLGASARNGRMLLFFYDDAFNGIGSSIGTTASSIPSGGAFTEVSHVMEVPAGATKLEVNAWYTDAVASEVFQVGSVEVTR